MTPPRSTPLAAWLVVLAGVSFATDGAWAQKPLDPGQTVPPPGHPPVTSAAPALPPGHPPTGSAPPAAPTASAAAASQDPALPPGHPPTSPTGSGSEELPEGHPSPAAPDSQPPPNRVLAADDLPAGTVEVLVRDASSNPVANQDVELAVKHHDVAEGDTTERRVARTDASGKAVFHNLPIDTAYTFAATVAREGAKFVSGEFRIGEGEAKRAVIHVFPVVRSLGQALVGLRAVVFVQPREDVYRVDVSYQVFNIGRTAWLPSDVRVALPREAEAFRTPENEGELRAEKVDGFVTIAGTVAPGQQELGYGYQVESDRSGGRSFTLPLLPRVAELRIIVEGGRSVELDVEGFPEPQRMRGQGGVPLLVTGRQAVRGDAPLDKVSFAISGLPTPSHGRWYAVAIATAIAAAGLWVARPGGSGKRAAPVSGEDTSEARKILLDELVLLEDLRKRDAIGPRTYETTRRSLLDALARLELHAGSVRSELATAE